MKGEVFEKNFRQNVPWQILGKVIKFQEYLIRNKTFADDRREGGSTRPSHPGLDRVKMPYERT